MNDALLLTAAALAVLLGAAHTWLGERYILTRLFRRRDLPKLYGSDWFTRRTLRFAWHVTTVAWWGFAAVLVAAATAEEGSFRDATMLAIVATFLVSAVVAAVGSRGRHLSWIVFLAIALLVLGS